MKQRLTNCRLFDGENVYRDKDLLLANGQVVDVIDTAAGFSADFVIDDIGGRLLAPGLIDLQVNGGGGVLFNDAPTVDALQTIATAHRQYGTTAILPTLITDSDDVVDAALAAVTDAIAAKVPGIIGIHLEGPYLNPRYKGVHDAGRMRAMDDAAVARIEAFRAGPTLLTLAPETVASELISRLSDSGIIVFGGHSAATYEQTRQALDAGMRGFTHLFNAMSPMQSRAPGMVGAALEDRDSYFGIIADGHHVHPAVFSIAVAAKTQGKALLVTDAMPSVGSDRKTFDLFGVAVRAEGGRCLTVDGTLAGADIGMITAVKNASTFAGLDRFEALRMASAYPAAALGVDDQLGYLKAGYRANLIELDADMNVCRSWIDGDVQIHSH